MIPISNKQQKSFLVSRALERHIIFFVQLNHISHSKAAESLEAVIPDRSSNNRQ